MPAKPTSSKKTTIQERLSTLRQVSVLIVGSSALKESLLRDLSQAGAGKILFLDTNNAKHPWTPANVEVSVRQADIVIDALSDWQKKLALSDICMECETALVHCGITGFRFQIYTMLPGRSACLRCALPLSGMEEVPLQPTKEEIMEAVIELAAAWQSLEAIKYLAKIGVVQGNELIKFDCLSGELEVIRGLDADPECPDCGRKFNKHKK
jgi:molybdopterin/thiamine biosynthesis adenylyltransferase